MVVLVVALVLKVGSSRGSGVPEAIHSVLFQRRFDSINIGTHNNQ